MPRLTGDACPERRAAVVVSEKEWWSGRVGEVTVAPLNESQGHREQVAASLRERVLMSGARARLLVGATLKNTDSHEFAQARGSDSFGNARPMREVVKAPSAVEGLAYQQHCGATADRAHSAVKGATVSDPAVPVRHRSV